jgi:hypothetical protein
MRRVALFLLLATTAGAEEPRRYTVRPGDDCTSIAARFYGSRSAYKTLHEANPGLGPPPHKLVPGTILIVPLPRPDASLTRVERVVEKVDAGLDSWEPAQRGDELRRGAKVATRRAAEAEITFVDQTVVELRADTMVILHGAPAAAGARRGPEAQLEHGALRSRLGELAGGPTLAVVTPGSRTTLQGGQALITVDDGKMSRIANHGGKPAEVRARSGPPRPVRVEGGMGTRVAQGAPPEPARPLLPAPEWTAPPPALLVGIGGAKLEVRWQPVDGARSYRVLLRRVGEGLVVNREAPEATTSLEISSLPRGGYTLAVASIDAAGLEGAPREQSFRVEELVLRSPLNGRVVAGSVLIPPDGLRCEGLTLDTPGRVVVPCENAAPLALLVEPAGFVLEDAPGNPLATLRAGAAQKVYLRQRGTPFTSGVELAATELTLRSAKQVRPGLWHVELAAPAGVTKGELLVVVGEKRVPVARFPLTIAP